MEYRYTALDQVHTNTSVTEVLPVLAEQFKTQRIFLVASRSLAAATHDFADLCHELGDKVVGLSTGIGAHTPRDDVLKVLKEVRASETDLLVSLGGGSVIDGCKTIQLAIDQDVSSSDALLEYAQRADGSRGNKAGNFKLFAEEPKIRQVAVPTTLSGAEFSNAAGVLDTNSQAKEGYRAPSLCAKAIIYDPALTLHTPQWLFFSTAIRSLDHAVEGFCSGVSSAYHQGQFLHAIRLFNQALPKVMQNPADLEARSLSQEAVWLACCGLGTVSHGASHGIGYILGSLCGVPHGYTSCVMLPAVLSWNADHQQEQQAAIAEAFGDNSQSVATLLKQLLAKLQLPMNLRDVGVDATQLDEIAERAIQHPVVKRNPKPLKFAHQVREILERAWE